MTENSSAIVSKVWSMADVLRDDGVSYGDYLEQITYLIFLKMAFEYSKPPYSREIGIPTECSWEKLVQKSGAELESHYKETLEALGNKTGILGEIYSGAQNKLSDPAKLFRVIKMVNDENWAAMSTDVKGDIYEGLLEKNAADTKSGAGQYFTPRPLIKAMVECVRPEPNKKIADPCCGSGGFFLESKRFIENNFQLNREQKEFLKFETFRGWEIVKNTYRLCLMHLLLHNIGDLDGVSPVTRNDALLSDSGERFDYVLTNPPFGKKSSMTFTNEEGEQEKEDLVYNRQDFWATGSNKQLNFVQHINTMLKVGGTAAVVVPDNVLFEGGAGETVRKKLLMNTNVHTILRLPTGIFYANGVKANVIFFRAEEASNENKTKEIWFYDLRTNMHFTLKRNPLIYKDLEDFVSCYNPDNIYDRKETWSENSPDGRFRRFTYEEILARDKTSLDIFWLKDKSLADLENLPDPDVLAIEILENLESAIDSFSKIVSKLEK